MGPPSPETAAVIDVGTNTVLMVTGRRREDGTVEVLDDAHAIARLGQGVDARRVIGPEAMERVCDVLRAYRERARALGASRIAAFGTSALRDAANKGEFVDHVRETTRLDLIEVTGAEEARLAFCGAAFGLALPERYSVLDIGGGSTELALGRRGRVDQFASVDVGAVRVTERFFGRLPPSPSQTDAALEMIREELLTLPPYPEGVSLVGVAGTATTLGAIDLELAAFDPEALNGHLLSRARVETLSARLLSLTLPEIRSVPQIHEQRADIVTAGALILRSALHLFGCRELTVSTRGIRYGLLTRALQPESPC